MLQIDFAENYSCTAQNETQAAHFSKKTISVFTAVATGEEYHGNFSIEKSLKIGLISDDKHHDTFSVFHYLKIIIQELKKNFKEFNRGNIFSDGSAAQFKNRFNIANIVNSQFDHGIDITWNFLATSHGKGEVDAVGGTVKSVVSRRVINQGIVINNARDFRRLAEDKIDQGKILFIHVGVDEMMRSRQMLEYRLKNVPTIVGIQKLHYFAPANQPLQLHCWPSNKKEDSYKKTIKYDFKNSTTKRKRGRPKKN